MEALLRFVVVEGLNDAIFINASHVLYVLKIRLFLLFVNIFGCGSQPAQHQRVGAMLCVRFLGLKVAATVGVRGSLS